MSDSSKKYKISERFIILFFKKMKPNDFKKDPFLKGFYNSYLIERDGKPAVEADPEKGIRAEEEFIGNINLTVFEYYMEYLLRNREYDIQKKELEISKLCHEIKEAIFTDPPSPDDDDNDKKTTKKKTKKAPVKKTKIVQNPGNPLKTVKLDRKHAINVLSDFIKASNIVTNETPDEDKTQHDEDFRNATTENILRELKEAGIIIPKPKKDINFNRRNAMLEIWRDTEHKCIKFIKNDVLANVLKMVYFIDGMDANKQTLKTLECKDVSIIESDTSSSLLMAPGRKKPKPVPIKLKYEQDPETVIFKDSYLPVETIYSRATHKKYDTIVNIVNSSPLSNIMEKTAKKISSVYICSGSQIVPGGNADQGIETNESVLYYASSYHLCIEKAQMAYPLSNTQMLVMPNILVFKNHLDPKYNMLPPTSGQKISVIMSPPVYRPETNIPEQEKHILDKKLYLPITKYKNITKITNRFIAMFNAALFFGYDTVIIDDQGVEDFWLPVHHTAEILNEVIKQFKQKFKEIIIAVEKKHIFTIYKKIIT